MKTQPLQLVPAAVSGGAAAAPAARRAPQPPDVTPRYTPEFRPQPAIQHDTQEALIQAAQVLRDALGPMFHTEAHFDVDTQRHQVRVEIVDESGEIVRQIPSEALQRFADSFDRFLGLVVDEHV